MSPLDMVKKARELAGDVTDIGTADDLWGPLEPLKKLVSHVRSVVLYVPLHSCQVRLCGFKTARGRGGGAGGGMEEANEGHMYV